MRNPFLNSNAATIAGETVTTAVKILDKLDLFENDGLVASIPLGKTVQALWKMGVKITDPQKAARYSVGIAMGTCFGAGLLEFQVTDLELTDRDQKSLKASLQNAMDEGAVDFSGFGAENLHITELAKKFEGIYFTYFRKSDVDSSREEKDKVEPHLRSYVHRWLKIFWQRLVEAYPDRYAAIDKFKESKSFALYQEELARMNYEQGLVGMYLSAAYNNENIRLDQLYLEPNCQVQESICRAARSSSYGDRYSKFIDNKEVSLPNKLHDLTLQWLTGKLDTSQLVGNNQQLLLLYGMPGQGKTSFCKRLLHDLSSSYFQNSRPLYFLRLRRVQQPRKLKQAALDYLREEVARVNKITVSEADFDRSILVLDGMDELAMSSDMPISDADAILENILDELREKDQLHVIITSRHGYLHKDRKLDHTLILQLEEMNRSQQILWLHRYESLTGKATLTSEKLESIPEDSILGKLITQPLLIQLVADLDSLPANTSARAAVYQRLFDHLVDPSWKKEQIDALKGLVKADVQEIYRYGLQEMAFAMFQSGKDYLVGEQVERLPAIQELKSALGKETTEEAFRLMYISFYFREVTTDEEDRRNKRGDYAIEFAHKSFGEFLATECFYRQLKEDFLEKKRSIYKLNDPQEAVEKWHALASVRPFTQEMVNYLIELIEQDEETYCQQMKDRLLHFGDALFANGFLFQNDHTVYSINPIERGIESCYLWFIMIGHLDSRPIVTSDSSFRTELLRFLQLLTIGKNRKLRLVKSNFFRANLAGASLIGINFTESTLRLANLLNANLYEANLQNADLRGANLRGANLFNANLAGAKLHGVKLSGAQLSGAQLSGVDLSEAEDLSNIRGLSKEVEANLRSDYPKLFRFENF